MKHGRGGFFQITGTLALIIIGVFFYLGEAASKTIVKKTGECVREVHLNIQLNTGGKRWTDAQLAHLNADQKKAWKDFMDNYTNYTEAELAKIGAEWKAEVENAFNGPTEDQVNAVAGELGYTDAQVSAAAGGDMALRKEIADKVAKHLEQYGGSPDSANCTEINCCKIYFKVNVKIKKAGEAADPDYHQIKVMKKGYRSNVTTHADGLHGNHKGTEGSWAYDPANPWGASAAHECGHLMGLDDQYTDAAGTNPGHEHDIMGVSFGYPTEEGIQEILTAGGAACDCCPKLTDGITTAADGLFQDYGMTFMVAGDALLTKNCPHMKAALKSFQGQLKTLNLTTGLSITARADLVAKLNSQIKKLTAAIKDCDPPATTTGIGLDGFPYAPFSYDSLECTTYGGGTVPFPIPGFPYLPGNPVFPVGPTQGPAGVPGIEDPGGVPRGGTFIPGTPENPTGTPPGSTPGATDIPSDGFKIPSTPGKGELINPGGSAINPGDLTPKTPGGKTIIPFNKYDYDDNQNVVRPSGAREGDEVKTPYDDASREYYDGVTIENEGEIKGGNEDDGIDIEGVDLDELWIDEEPEHKIPFYLVFKVEADVVQENGTVEKGPAEKTVLKLGFPVPPKPGAGTVRTAENTDAGAGAEPRFVETDENGIGQIPIFEDGFESGDVTRWSDSTPAPTKKPDTAGRPEGDENKNTNPGTYHVAGFTLDATPRKSRIVYLVAGADDPADPLYRLSQGMRVDPGLEDDVVRQALEGAGVVEPTPPVRYGVDDLNENGVPDWAEIRPELEDEIANESLRAGGLFPPLGHAIDPGVSAEGGTPTVGGGDDDDKIVGPNVPTGGGTPKTELPDDLKGFEIDRVRFGDTWGVTLGYKFHEEEWVLNNLTDFLHQDNRYLKEKMDDPYYESAGTWDQPYDDQWAIKSVGFTDDENGAWAAAGDDLEPVIVAFIDTGIDWNHADISWDNIWINEDEIAGNGIDDDMNGYIDDTIGWDFYTNNPSPWDQDGHGTFTAGMVIATQNNGIGISGINPAAKIMVLKALNDFGHTRASYVSKAIKYATDNGARIINLSIGGEHQTYLERLAIKYAHDRGVLIVVAAGNEAMDVSTYGFVPYPEVIAVASSDYEGGRAFFSNLGPEIDIAAPGLDVLSLRARMTDFMRHLKDVAYEPGSGYVGEDKRYFRSSGTSFSAPIVTGIASLILSMNPDLTNVEVKRMILNSARDVEIPGTDQFTGYGVVDATAALNADPAFEIMADISGVEAVQDETGAFFVNVSGSANANEFAGASVQIGIGDTPTAWKEVATVDGPVTNGALAQIDANEFRAAPTWTIRVVVTHANGSAREQWYVLELG